MAQEITNAENLILSIYLFFHISRIDLLPENKLQLRELKPSDKP